MRKLAGGGAEDFVFLTSAGCHWVETDWRNYRLRHFVPALERVEAEWEGWRDSLPDPGHSIRVLDETYSEQLTEYEQRAARIDPVAEIAAARHLVWGDRDAATGR